MKNICKKIVFLLVLSIILKTNIIVKADVSVTDGGLSSGSNSPCGTYGGYVACYSPRFQFRVTLVDKNGKKVAGTRSVDVSYSDNNNTYVDDTIRGVKLINKNFEYKYSDVYNDYNDTDSTTDKDNFIYIRTYLADLKDQNGKYKYKKYLNGGQDDYTNYDSFYTAFSNKLQDRNDTNVYFDSNLNTKSDLLSVILYHTGYIKVKTNIDSVEEGNDIAKKDYYLLIEPTYTIYYNTTPWSWQYNYVYGTGNEILKWMKNEIENNNSKYMNGYLVGLSLNFVYQLGCNMYSTPEIKNEFGLITEETLCGTNTDFYKKTNIKTMYASRSDRTLLMEMALNKNKGYGASVLRLKNTIPDPGSINKKIDVNIDLCKSGDGSVSLNLNDDIENDVINDIFKVSGTGMSSIYCYDKTEYDFEDIIKIVNNQTFKNMSNIEIPNVTAIINRSCYFQSNLALESKAKNYDEYKNQELKLKVFNEDINLKFKDIKVPDPTGNRTASMGKGWLHWTTEVTYSYQGSDGTNKYYLSPNREYGTDGYVGFSVDNIYEIFGKSNNLVNQLMESPNQTKIINGNEYKLNFTDGNYDKDGFKCNFTYTVENQTPPPGETPPPGDEQGNPPDVLNSIVDFRIISLSNPFPARDGTSRLPGLNWLNTENYVYNYITNNRGIQYVGKANNSYAKITYDNGNKLINPEEMYNKIEPMYTITLDPSTMMEIRKYNKDRTYSDIDLECNDQKRECTSKFLRNSAYIPEDNLSGTCSDSRNYHIVLEDYSSLTMENVRKYVYGNSNNYYSVYDLNKNGMMDTEDVEILEKHLMTEEELKALENKEKNTNFYTCANKSYKSGG